MKLSTRDVMMWAGAAVAVLILLAVLTSHRAGTGGMGEPGSGLHDRELQEGVDQYFGYHVDVWDCHAANSNEDAVRYECAYGLIIIVDRATGQVQNVI